MGGEIEEEGFALISEQLERLQELQKKANQLAQSQMELTAKTNELLKEIKVGVFFTPTPIKGVPPTTAAPAAAPTKRRASLSETAERLKKEGEGLPKEEGK